VIDACAFQLLLMVVTGWLARREREVVVYLIEENQCLRRQLGTRRVRLTMPIAGGWPREHTGWAERPCGRSPPSRRRRTLCCAGIGS
jgi:hypothetical protein